MDYVFDLFPPRTKATDISYQKLKISTEGAEENLLHIGLLSTRVSDFNIEICSMKAEELKQTQKNINNLTKVTTQNSSDIQGLIKAYANTISQEDFNKLTNVVEANTEALRCLSEIVKNQQRQVPSPPS
ncbi:hypothetical protein L6452_34954 [Arctium lappa]|uniref:Uncharacterized protein n=1 Tax=Arctium lappa TaxID=4217 RepID=A0ACB8YJK7_ARCLA|nr:hypothetical protein L6452_34954 [Arctium lappa]